MIYSIAAIATLLAAAAQDTAAARVSIMGDRAEELGYDRPPGLTPAWARYDDRKDVWVPWFLSSLGKTYDSCEVPNQFPWMTHEQWSQIHRDFIYEELPYFAELYDRAAEFHHSPTRGMIGRDIDAIRRRLPARSLDLRSVQYDELHEFYRDQQFRRLDSGELDLLSLNDVIRHILSREKWKGLSPLVRHMSRISQAIRRPAEERIRAYERQYRLFCTLIDDIAPWQLD